MTGLECLREEMKRRGCCKAQIESKTAAIVLDILANGGGIYEDLHEAEEKLSLVRAKIDDSARELARVREQLKLNWWELSAAIESAKRKNDADRQEIEELERRICELETAEARDALRKAQVFQKACYVNTKYDNTAFINGLAAILAGKKPEAAE